MPMTNVKQAMIQLPVLLIYLLLTTSARAIYTYSVFEDGNAPETWVKSHRLEPETKIQIRVALAQRNLDKAEYFITDVSDPTSSNYGKFWTPDKIYDTFAPAEETIATVREWLITEGVRSDRITQSEDKGWFYLNTHVKEAERLFRTKYHYFGFKYGRDIIASDSYSIPDSLRENIDFVEVDQDIIRHEPVFKEFLSPLIKCKGTNLTCCDELVHPGCIRALYSLPNKPEHEQDEKHPHNALGIYEQFGKDSMKDLNMFFKRYAPFIPRGTHPKSKIYGHHVKLFGPDGEAALDYDCAYPIVYPQVIETLNGAKPLEHLFNKTAKPQKVISTSYFEGYEHGPKSKSKWSRECNGYMKLALMGTSVLASSGDEGTGCPIHKDKAAFKNQIPAACPFVTSVGGTEIPKGNSIHQPEIAVREFNRAFTSGGGFSQLFSAPGYQKDALAKYFSKHDPGIPFYNGTKQFPSKGKHKPKYNRLGRGFPDVSANGKNIATALGGKYRKSGGTSASAPIFAAIINQIVEKRLKAGKGPLGFLNPALYQNPAMFNDVTKGFNSGCGYKTAFHAVEGWDPVTGLGTPNYPKMLKYFMNL